MLLHDFKIDIEPPEGDETESHIVVYATKDDVPIIDAPAAAVEAFALRLIRTVDRAKRKRHPEVQRS